MDTKICPLVSIIIPCRNEEKFISKCLDSILQQDYPKEKLEILVIDGNSEDKTKEIVRQYLKKYSFIKLLDNPKRFTNFAFNIGIKSAVGEIIIIMGAHAIYKKDYVSKCVEYLQKYNADNVGGVLKTVPTKDTLFAKCIAVVLSHPFGVGNAYFRRDSASPKWVDTVFGGCYKKEVFDKIGLFNEKLIYSQDIEFNQRLRKTGGKILLVPDIVTYYYARSDFKSFCKHNFRNGLWAILPFKYTNTMPVSWRHLVPLAFVTSLIGSAILSPFSPFFFWLFSFILGSYLLTNFYFSSKVAFKQKDFRYLLTMPIIFTSLHVVYGLGSLWGFLKVSISKQFWKNLRKIII
ncbi:MAG: glycosyltransferase family 2 protein [Candidatus Desulfofervidus auxilii]|nr:glycosyltransferase family 2 protein [Candidatus Desulfofervidus auxilii]